MTTKEYLSQIQKLNKMVRGRQEDLEELVDIAQSVTSIRPVSDLVISSGHKDRLSDLIVKIVDAEIEYEKLIDKYLAKKSTIVNQIEKLEISEFNILRLRFVSGFKFSRVLEELNKEDICSERKMYRTYNRALRNFEKEFGKTYKWQ